MSEIRKFQWDLQGLLGGRQFPNYGIDGKWGPETQSAMHRYQEAHGLDKTDLPDLITVQTINSETPGRIELVPVNYSKLQSEIARQTHGRLEDLAQRAGSWLGGLPWWVWILLLGGGVGLLVLLYRIFT